MKKNIICSTFALIFAIFSVTPAFTENVRKETFIYAVKNSDTLRMDKYDIPSEQKKPCVIFVFGGGFYSGSRTANQPYYDFLLQNGFSVIAIDYRLGLKNVSADKNLKTKDFLNIFENTIKIAVEDLFDATNYVLNNAEKWNIDKNKIVISGSSAGGITVLQAEYERCNRCPLATVRLPDDFKYAGVISFAGAIYSKCGNLKWTNTPAPLQMFHGDADRNVPFNKLKLFKYGFYGSEHIAKRYDKNNFSYYFYKAENADHRIASTPMIENQEEIKSFLQKYVLDNEPLVTNVSVSSLNQPKVKKNFKIKDYIKANF